MGGGVGRGPEVVVDGGVDLVDAVDPAAVGVEDEVARAGARAVVGEESGRLSRAVSGSMVKTEMCRCRGR